MKFTVLGFSQPKLVELGISVTEALLLRGFVDFRDAKREDGSQVMISKIIDEKPYYWFQYDFVREEYPVLGLNSADSVYKKLKKLAEKGVLEHKTVRAGGTYSYYCLGPRYYELLSDSGKENEVKYTDEEMKLIKYFEANICQLREITTKDFLKICEVHQEDFIMAIIDLCTSKGTSFNYFKKVIKQKVKEGITTKEGLKEAIEAYRKEQEAKKIAALKEKDNISKPVEEAKEKLEEIKDTKITVEEIIEKDDIEIIKDIIKPKLKAVEFKAWIENLKVLKDKNKILIVSGSEFARNKVQKVYEYYIIAALKEANITYDFIEYKVEE